jgi:hypothetical protein
MWLLIPLVLALAVIADGRGRLRMAFLTVCERIAVRAYAAHVRRRRARALTWINGWRREHGLPPLRAWRKGVRQSRRHGILARNMEVVAYGGGVWMDRNGRSGAVPGYVADFAEDFDDGLFEDLVGELMAMSAPKREAARAASGLSWVDRSMVA